LVEAVHQVATKSPTERPDPAEIAWLLEFRAAGGDCTRAPSAERARSPNRYRRSTGSAPDVHDCADQAGRDRTSRAVAVVSRGGVGFAVQLVRYPPRPFRARGKNATRLADPEAVAERTRENRPRNRTCRTRGVPSWFRSRRRPPGRPGRRPTRHSQSPGGARRLREPLATIERGRRRGSLAVGRWNARSQLAAQRRRPDVRAHARWTPRCHATVTRARRRRR
jgi:hypothetical protein